MQVDLRSDTVTQPTAAMKEVMLNAKVGDDVYGEDPTVNELEKYAANYLGMEAAIFCPSGTMTNQIGINVLSQPYEEVICYEGSHIYKYEGGGVAGTSGLSMKLLKGDRGRLALNDIKEAINPDDIHAPITSIVSLENTVNKGGGSYYSLSEIKAIGQMCQQHGLKFHLDGARLFNALVETGGDPKEYGKHFDTISICLSKGLGAPVGSLLVGKAEHIKKARRVRKFMGGGMRQAGFIAAAGLYALQNNIERLKEDHKKARVLGQTLASLPYVEEVLPVDTNIVIFKLAEGISTAQYLDVLKQHQIFAGPFGPREIRFVTHLDYNDQMLEYTVDVIKKIPF